MIQDPQAREEAQHELKMCAMRVRRNLWSTTSIAVTNNPSRQAINMHKICVYAQQTNQPVLCWHNTLPDQLGQQLSSDPTHRADLDRLREENPELTSVFAAGAPGYLLANISPVKGYANGTPVTYHSLRFATGEDERCAQAAIHEWECTRDPWKLVLVPVPEAVNVQVPTVLANEGNVNQRVGTAPCLDTIRTVDGDVDALKECVVIPVPLLHKLPSSGKHKYETLSLPKSLAMARANPDCTATVTTRRQTSTHKLRYELHPVTVAFAMTYNKLQGQTKDRLVLDVNAVPRGLKGLGLKHLVVGFSRVKSRDGLRLFPIRDGNPRTKYKHLTSKTYRKSDPELKTYLAGFQGDGTRYERPP